MIQLTNPNKVPGRIPDRTTDIVPVNLSYTNVNNVYPKTFVTNQISTKFKRTDTISPEGITMTKNR